jgi:hypothetical protein
MAGIEGKTLNGMLVRVVGQGLLWRRRIMESYVRGEVPQEKTIALLEVRQASALPKLLALEGLPIPM